MARPAAALTKVLARPAAAPGRARGVARGVLPERWLCDVAVPDLAALGTVHLQKASYYGNEVNLVGTMLSAKVEGGQTFVEMTCRGTQDEGLLRVMTGRRERTLTIHVCPRDCGDVLSDEALVHGKSFKVVRGDEAPWMSNLVEAVGQPVEEDELKKLREEKERLEREVREAKETPKKDKKKDKKAKKKKKEKDEDAEEEKRRKDKRKKIDDSSSEELEVGQKTLQAVFGDTGLDPDVKKRNRIARKASRIGKKKKKKKSTSGEEEGSGSGSSSSSPEEEANPQLFDGDKKLHAMWKRYPGALASSASSEARQHLVSASGAVWAVDKKKVSPVFTLYARQCLMPLMSPPMAQETITISQCLDLLLQGHMAASCDVLAQRLKALESSAKGGHWTVSRQLELIKMDAVSVAEDEEARQAARRAREDEKLRRMMTTPQPSRPYDGNAGGNKGGRKGKDWKGGRGRADDAGRGKGGKKQKNDQKGGWQKEDNQKES